MGHVATSRVGIKRDARSRVILDEAMAILAAEGLDALTLARLAKALGYVPAALYRYFDSKDALVAALQRRAVTAIHAGLGEAERVLDEVTARVSPGVAILAKLVGAARFYLELPRTDPESAFLVMLLLGDPRPLISDEESRRTAPLLLALLSDVAALFRTAEGRGVLSKGDITERTLAFWAALSGALSLEKTRRIAPSIPSPLRIGTVTVEALLVGWGASAHGVEEASRLIAKSTSSKRKSGTKKARS